MNDNLKFLKTQLGSWYRYWYYAPCICVCERL